MVKSIVKTPQGHEFLISTETVNINKIYRKAAEVASANNINTDKSLWIERLFRVKNELDLKFTDDLKKNYFAGKAQKIISAMPCSDGSVEYIEHMLDYEGNIYILSLANGRCKSFKLAEL